MDHARTEDDRARARVARVNPVLDPKTKPSGGGVYPSSLSGKPKPELDPREAAAAARLRDAGFDPTIRALDWRALFDFYGAPVVEQAFSQWQRSNSVKRKFGPAAIWKILDRLASPIARSADAQLPTAPRDDRAPSTAAQLWHDAREHIGAMSDAELAAARDRAADWLADRRAAEGDLPARVAAFRSNFKATPLPTLRHDRASALHLFAYLTQSEYPSHESAPPTLAATAHA